MDGPRGVYPLDAHLMETRVMRGTDDKHYKSKKFHTYRIEHEDIERFIALFDDTEDNEPHFMCAR